MKPRFPVLAAALFFVFTGEASAHTFGAHGAGFTEGVAHPFLGLDHLLAMLAVGLWAAQRGGAARWSLPLAFLAAMAGGALLANLGVQAAFAETLIAFSVLALGGLIAGRARPPLAVGAAAVAVFALGHGYAHGLEMPEAGSPWGYGAGFLLATASLHGAGVLLGSKAGRPALLVRAGGAVIAAAGLILLAAG